MQDVYGRRALEVAAKLKVVESKKAKIRKTEILKRGDESPDTPKRTYRKTGETRRIVAKKVGSTSRQQMKL